MTLGENNFWASTKKAKMPKILFFEIKIDTVTVKKNVLSFIKKNLKIPKNLR